MSRLSDVIGRVIEETRDAFGRIDTNAAVMNARPMLDDDDCEVLIADALGKRIKDAATKASRSEAKRSPAQKSFPFPDLRVSHAIDIDGRYIKLTTEMTEMEFRRVIDIRRKQVEDDKAYLDILERAYRDVEPLWRAMPDATFGEVCRVHTGEIAA